MRLIAPAVLAALLLTPSVYAQRFVDITANAVWLDPTGGGSFEELEDPTEIDFDSDLGYGAAVNLFIGERMSIELAAARVEPESSLTRRRAAGPVVTSGDLQITPLTATLQFHFAPNGFIDPYIGAGAAYVLYDFSEGPETDDIDQLDFDDDVGLAVNAGLGIRLGNNFGLNFDAKYVPIESNATAVIIGENEEAEGTIEVSPIIVSAGISLRF